MVEAAKHPNIKLYTYTEIKKVTGGPGEFVVTLLKKPRYVDETKCTGCGSCTEKCPVEVPDEFNFGLGTRKAIYIPFSQAVPKIALISMEDCIQCKLCERQCLAGAINYDQKPEEITVKVGAIVVASGTDMYDVAKHGDYGYGIYEDVITQAELERMLSPTGPTGGRLLRVSDRKTPKRIAMIQCVGSRDVKKNPYCSEVCCMVALKNAKLIKQEHPDAEVTIWYIDIRAVDEGHEEYYRRAREYGINFIRGMPEVTFNGKSLVIEGENTLTSEFVRMEVDLVVLSTAVVPSKAGTELGQLLGLDRAASGFLKPLHTGLNPQETKTRAIFICGTAQGPKDISYSVSSARAAASAATAWCLTGEASLELITPVVIEELCVGCKRCERNCPFGAIKVIDGVAKVDETICKGCGICVASCPAHALDLRYYRDKQIQEEVSAIVKT
ncbi:MAG: CoB--CoM heterodisulfide reductase iron-sulfur subunit A family protein [Candidatus Jordarchaeaceae archaeon]